MSPRASSTTTPVANSNLAGSESSGETNRREHLGMIDGLFRKLVTVTRIDRLARSSRHTGAELNSGVAGQIARLPKGQTRLRSMAHLSGGRLLSRLHRDHALAHA